jgi:UDP-glucose 4-epimerase
VLIAGATRAERLLNWKPRYSSIETIVMTALNWQLRREGSGGFADRLAAG